MNKKKIQAIATFEVQYDENSKEFQKAFKAYALIDGQPTVETFILHVIHWISQYGVYEFIDSIGYVSINGILPEQDWCGIDICKVEFDTNGTPVFAVGIIPVIKENELEFSN